MSKLFNWIKNVLLEIRFNRSLKNLLRTRGINVSYEKVKAGRGGRFRI